MALALAALLVLFFTQVTPERVERELEKALRQSLPAKSVEAKLEGEPGFPTLQGKFRRLTIRMDGLSFRGGQLLEMLPVRFTNKPEKEGCVGEVRLLLRDADYEGLHIAELAAYAQTVRFDLKGSLREKRLVLVSAASGTLTGFITAASIERYLKHYATEKGVEDAQVRLRHGSVEVEGRWRVEVAGVSLLRIPFSAVAELFPVNGNELHWRLVSASLADLVPLPADWLQERFKAFNPLVRFDLSPLKVQWRSMSVTQEGIHLSADFSLRPPEGRLSHNFRQ